MFHGGLAKPGDVLKYDIHIDGHARQDAIRLFFFHYDCVIDGIIYSSSREGGERAFVLFCENEQCFAVEDGPVFLEQLLNLTAVAHEQA